MISRPVGGGLASASEAKSLESLVKGAISVSRPLDPMEGARPPGVGAGHGLEYDSRVLL